MSEFDNASTETLLAYIIARYVAHGVEMARSIGHQMPREYDVGYSKRVIVRHRAGMDVKVKLRLDDASYEVAVLVPYLDERSSIVELNQRWESMMDSLRSAALTLAQVWLEKHPEAVLKGASVEAALVKLDAIARNDATEAAWAEECRLKAQAARFSARQ